MPVTARTRRTRRSPLAGSVPRPAKRRAGRTDAPRTPVHFRALHVTVSAAMRAHARERLGFKLGKVADAIERVSVRLSGAPEHGTGDVTCSIKVVLTGLPGVVVVHSDPDAWAALDGALDRVERALRKTVDRRRVAPVSRGRRIASAKRGRGAGLPRTSSATRAARPR
jgi:ribosomal subunit interface protein